MRKNLILFPVLIAATAFAIAARQPENRGSRMSDFRVFDPVADVYFQIEDRFYRDIDPVELQRGMIRGMIEALDDPYTEYIPPAALEDFDKRVLGEYVGIGAEVNTLDGYMLIISPMDDSPAYEAGLEADDLVVAVNGETTFNKDLTEIIESLAGTPGTQVTVTVEREGTEADIPENALPATVAGPIGEAPGPGDGNVRFDLLIKRRRIVTSTVKGVHRVNDEWSYVIDPVRMIGYIRVTQFTGGTIPELKRACNELVDEGLTGLILDLRFNTGGSLAAAVQMADLFIDEGLIVSTKGRKGDEERAYAREEGTLPDFPMVVLVNSGSASASEVVSGALSDSGRAKILGERTFGKGIVQSVVALPSGEGHLKVTEQDYYLPSGRSIQREDDSAEWGVDPDDGFYLPMTNDEYRTMLRVRRQNEIIRANAPADEAADWSDPVWILETLKDKQLSAAVRAIRGKLASGEWDAVGEEVPEGTIELSALRLEQERYELLAKELARSQTRIDALATRAADSDEDPFDTVPGDENLTGGTLVMRDADGNVVAEFTVNARSLDSWIWDAPIVLKADEMEPAPAVTLILGIESSCDETAASVVEGGRAVCSNAIASQHELHAEYGGVVPEIASRAHAERILPIITRALHDAGATYADLDAIAVGNRPGLIGSLLVGVSAAKTLAWSLGLPLIGIDHVHAHLYAGLMAGEQPIDASYPALGLVVSGGHSSIYLCADPLACEEIGRTIDDALGEAYDKVAALLHLGHPGGPVVDRRAQNGDDRAHDFPVSRLSKESLDFSFSGLKTSVLYAVRGIPTRGEDGKPAFERTGDELSEREIDDVCASFQRAAVRAVILKLGRALDALAERGVEPRSLLVGGGVSANSRLRDELTAFAAERGLGLKLPPMDLCLDNAAMIAGLAHERFVRGDVDDLSLAASPTGGAS